MNRRINIDIILEFMQQNGLNIKKFAECAKIKESVLINILSGSTEFAIKDFLKICNFMNIWCPILVLEE